MTNAIILAAGKGTRLMPLTDTMPKVMLPLGNRPLLDYVIDACVKSGVTNITLVVGYKKEIVLNHLAKRSDVDFTYIVQEKQLGTAHALLQAKDCFGAEPFIVLPGDNFIDPQSVKEIIDTEKEYALLINKASSPSYYGVVETSASGDLKILDEKPTDAHSARYVSTGIYKFSPDICSVLEERCSIGMNDLPDIIQHQIASGIAYSAVQTTSWDDITHPWDLLRINSTIAEVKQTIAGTIEEGVTLKGPVSIGEGSIICSGAYLVGPIIIGKNCEIGPNTCIYPTTTIGNDVVVDGGEIRNSILMDGVHIGSGGYVSNSIIAKGATIQHGFSTITGESTIHHRDIRTYRGIGVLVGSDTVIESHVVTRPGIRIGSSCTIAPLKTIYEDIESAAKVM